MPVAAHEDRHLACYGVLVSKLVRATGGKTGHSGLQCLVVCDHSSKTATGADTFVAYGLNGTDAGMSIEFQPGLCPRFL